MHQPAFQVLRPVVIVRAGQSGLSERVEGQSARYDAELNALNYAVEILSATARYYGITKQEIDASLGKIEPASSHLDHLPRRRP